MNGKGQEKFSYDMSIDRTLRSVSLEIVFRCGLEGRGGRILPSRGCCLVPFLRNPTSLPRGGGLPVEFGQQKSIVF